VVRRSILDLDAVLEDGSGKRQKKRSVRKMEEKKNEEALWILVPSSELEAEKDERKDHLFEKWKRKRTDSKMKI
jgi:hypothetical protein